MENLNPSLQIQQTRKFHGLENFEKNDTLVSDNIICVLINGTNQDKIFLAKKILELDADSNKVKNSIFQIAFGKNIDLDNEPSSQVRKNWKEFFENINFLSNQKLEKISPSSIEIICRSNNIKDLEFLEKNKQFIDEKLHSLIINSKIKLLEKTQIKTGRKYVSDNL